MHKDWFSPCPGTSLCPFDSLSITLTHTCSGPMGMSDWALSCLPFLIRGKSIEDLGLELGLIELCSLCSLIAAKSVLSSQHLVHTVGPSVGGGGGGAAGQWSDRACGCHREGGCIWLSDLVKSGTHRKGIANRIYIGAAHQLVAETHFWVCWKWLLEFKPWFLPV